MRQKKYDVFISYRRQGGRDVARILQLQLEQRGVRCFFDFDELQSGDFNEAIYDAISNARYLILVMSTAALDRCVNEGDWVRREIEFAAEKNVSIIPVAPSDAPRTFPRRLPPSLEFLRKLQIAPLNMEDLLEESVDKIVRKNLVGIELKTKTAAVGAGEVVLDPALDIPELGKPIQDVELTRLSGEDRDRFARAIRMYQVLRARTALAEFRKISNQDDPIVRYYVLRLAVEFEPDVDESEFERACVKARDLGCTDAMVMFAARNLNAGSEFGVVSFGDCVAWLKKAIGLGNPYAYVVLASAYEQGRGVSQDRSVAHVLKLKAAARCIGGRIALAADYTNGVNVRSDAQKARETMSPVFRHLRAAVSELTGENLLDLATCYLLGVGVARDTRRASEILAELACIKGCCATKTVSYADIAKQMQAMAISMDIAAGREVPESDRKRMVELLREATEHPHPTVGLALWMLGRFHEDGVGVAADSKQAIALYERAIGYGNDLAMRTLAELYLQEGELKDVEKARTLMEDAASKGNPAAQASLGTRYAEGAFGTKDFEKAIAWWKKAAGGGDGEAMDRLGRCFRDGLGGTAVDHQSAVGWFRKGAARGHGESMKDLAMACLNGQGVAVDKKEAERLLVQAADQGCTSAACTLGMCYYRGDFGTMEHDRAVSRWIEAAEGGNTMAMCNLARVYLNGDAGLQKDLQKAVQWYEKACAAGDKSAMNALGVLYYDGTLGGGNLVKAFELQLESARRGDVGGMVNVAGLYFRGEGCARNVGQALSWYRRAAEAGDADAMIHLGKFHLFGIGVEENGAAAEMWLLKAAKTGHPEAACLLGAGYYEGRFGEKDFTKTLQWTRQAVEAGNVQAMCNLGKLYYDGGAGLRADGQQAVKWFRKAAEKGAVDAMIHLGQAYLDGVGVLENVNEAERWFVRGAGTGSAEAECVLGTRYYQGAFGSVDYARAVDWWTKAAEQGHSVAMGNLAAAYRYGEGVERDMARAEVWYLRASEAGNADATCSLAMGYFRGEFGQADKVKAFEWLQKAAELGDADAMCNLGWIYQHGKGVAVDMKRAVAWYVKSAERGCAMAMEDLGFVYLRGGAGVLIDRVEAEKWFVKAAETGNGASECCLGTQYYEGAFGEVSVEKAVRWWKKAAGHGDVDALSNLGRLYMDGRGNVARDVRSGLLYLKTAAEAGDSYAMLRLAVAYLQGEGVAIDENLSREWLTKAVDAGNPEAERELGRLLIAGEFGERDIQGGIEMLERAAAHGDCEALSTLGRVYGDPYYLDEAVKLDVSRAVDYFRKADEQGVGEAAFYLAFHTLGLLDRRLESYDDVKRELDKIDVSGGVRERTLRKARSWFNRTIENSADDQELVCSSLRWLARLERFEKGPDAASDLYREAIEKGDEVATSEWEEMMRRAGHRILSSEEVGKEVISFSDDDRPSSATSAETARAEAAFVHRVLRCLRRGNGALSLADEEKLEAQAKEFGIDLIRYEELLEQAERDFGIITT